MKIGELAASAGLNAKTIRYYEDLELLPEPTRLPNGYRDYDTSAIDRLSFIKDAQASGLSLVEIAMILDLRDQGESTCDHVIALLGMHLEDLDRQIDDMHRARAKLEALTKKARSLDSAACEDPNRCQTIARQTKTSTSRSSTSTFRSSVKIAVG